MVLKISKFTMFCFFIVFLIMSMVSKVEAHVFTVEETPKPNSVLESSPSEISIQFSGKVDKSFSMKVHNDEKQEIKVNSSTISEDQKTVSIQIPQLPNGNYRLEYYMISSNDGHTIEGLYNFQVESDVPPTINDDFVKEETTGGVVKKEEQLNEPIVSTEPTDVTEEKVSREFTELINYLAKTIYYLGLLLLIGWVLIWQIIKSYSIEVRKKYLFYGMIFQFLHLVGLVAFLLVQMNIFSSHGITFEFDFPLETNFGKIWIVSLVLSLIGFAFLFKNQLIDYGWILLIGIAKSLSGHTQEFEPTYLLVGLNSMHIFAASFWAAGLAYILLFWRKQQLYVKSFLPIFSKGAFISILLLILSGSVISYLYLPNWEALLVRWGFTLLAKIAVVFGVIILGAIIRKRMIKARLADLKSPLKIEFLLMIILIVIVSILTSINPLP